MDGRQGYLKRAMENFRIADHISEPALKARFKQTAARWLALARETPEFRADPACARARASAGSSDDLAIERGSGLPRSAQ